MSRAGFTVPPGRAGRLWLTRRLQIARRGADLLDRKLQILQAELGRFRDAEARTAAEWERCCADALTVAIRHAAAVEALGVIEAEALATRHRLRAIEDRWIPDSSTPWPK